MSTRQSHWSVPISEMVEKAKGQMNDVVRVATFNLFRSVVQLSPVDTGRFRSNWNMSYQEPDFSTSTDTDTSRGDAEAAKALTFSIGQVAYLCNGLPYAVPLEYGHSDKAPAGMVRVSVVQFNDYLADAVAQAAWPYAKK